MSCRTLVFVAVVGLFVGNSAERGYLSFAAEPATPPDGIGQTRALLAEFRAAKPTRERRMPGQPADTARCQADVGKDLMKLNSSAVPILIEALDDPEPRVAVVAALALGRIGDQRAAEPMLKILKSAIPVPERNSWPPPPGNQRIAASVCALGELREPRAVASIVALERMPTERNDLIEELGFKDHSWDYMCGIMPIVCGDAIHRIGIAAAPELVSLLSDGNAKLRAVAIGHLNRFGVHDEKYISDWLQPAEFRRNKKESVDARQKRITAERIVSDRVAALAGEKLIELLSDKKMKVQEQAARALGNLRVASAISPLIECLKDESWLPKSEAIESLGQIGGPAAIDALAALLENPDPKRLLEAEEAAEFVGGPKAFAFWKSDLQNADPAHRKAALHGLRVLGTPEAVDLLITGLKDQDRDVPFYAARCLGSLKGPVAARAVEPLIAAVREGDAVLRGEAIEALGQIADRRAVDPIIAALKDPEFRVGVDALEALGRIGDPKSVAPVKAMLVDRNPFIRRDAVQSLAELNPPDLADSLRPMLADDDKEVRDAAAAAIAGAAKHAVNQTKNQ